MHFVDGSTGWISIIAAVIDAVGLRMMKMMIATVWQLSEVGNASSGTVQRPWLVLLLLLEARLLAVVGLVPSSTT